MKEFVRNRIARAAVLLIFGFVFAQIGFADATDRPMGYHSTGTDFYADNTPVIDGECYALVWTRDGNDFAGFRADGSLIDANNNAIVHIRALAKDGKCPPVNFVVSEDYRAKHPGGTYRVIVLDTRGTKSTLAGLDENGQLIRVNGWGWAKVGRDDTLSKAKLLASSGSSSGAVIGNAALLPADVVNPRITSIRINAKGDAELEFVDSRRYLSYRVGKGQTVGSVGETKGDDLVEGAADDKTPVCIKVSKSELKEKDSAFFRIEAEDWGMGR